MDAFGTHSYDGKCLRVWTNYVCTMCGGVLLACADGTANPQSAYSVDEILPALSTVDEAVSEPARRYLTQAQNTLHAPDGAVMLAACAVDAMLKAKGYSEGSLYARIKKAAEDYIITTDMAQWAHHVRLEANDRLRWRAGSFLNVMPSRAKNAQSAPPHSRSYAPDR